MTYTIMGPIARCKSYLYQFISLSDVFYPSIAVDVLCCCQTTVLMLDYLRSIFIRPYKNNSAKNVSKRKIVFYDPYKT